MIAATTSPTPAAGEDPFLAALAAFHVANAAFEAACNAGLDEATTDALGDAEADAWETAATTIPTTPAGCAALIEAHGRIARERGDFLRGDAFTVLATVATALRQMGG